MLDKISGYKTYIVAALIGVLAAGKFLGYIDGETFATLSALLGGGGLAALRSGVAKGAS